MVLEYVKLHTVVRHLKSLRTRGVDTFSFRLKGLQLKYLENYTSPALLCFRDIPVRWSKDESHTSL
jgi:hypothetical protein